MSFSSRHAYDSVWMNGSYVGRSEYIEQEAYLLAEYLAVKTSLLTIHVGMKLTSLPFDSKPLTSIWGPAHRNTISFLRNGNKTSF
jgi:hypothetical protein